MINVDLCVISLGLNNCGNWAGQKTQTTHEQVGEGALAPSVSRPCVEVRQLKKDSVTKRNESSDTTVPLNNQLLR